MSKRTKDMMMIGIVAIIIVIVGLVIWISVKKPYKISGKSNVNYIEKENNQETNNNEMCDEEKLNNGEQDFSSKSKIAQAILNKKFLAENEIKEEQVSELSVYKLSGGEKAMYIIDVAYGKDGMNLRKITFCKL